MLTRVGLALGLLVFIAVVVYLGRDGYVDAAGGTITAVDALYYASVTVTTTGYGDIAAVTPGTRVATLILITPARILFLILVVGTTVEVLTEQYRQLLAATRWRKRVQDHYVICGFGSTGQSASTALLANDVVPAQITAVDTEAAPLEHATTSGFTGVRGDASRVAVLQQAAVGGAQSVIVTPNRDDTAVLITLTVRELNPRAHIVVAVRERENLHLLRQSGADEVIDATAAVGRLLGLATHSGAALTLIDDLLEAGTSLEVAEVEPAVQPDGTVTVPAGVSCVEVLRDGRRLAYPSGAAGPLTPEDRLIVVRSIDNQ